MRTLSLTPWLKLLNAHLLAADALMLVRSMLWMVSRSIRNYAEKPLLKREEAGIYTVAANAARYVPIGQAAKDDSYVVK
jgi:hypothetical protein